MNILKQKLLIGEQHPENSNIDSLQDIRDRAMMTMGWALIPFLFPFSIFSFYQQKYVLGVLILVVVAIAVFNSNSIRRSDHRRVPYWVFFITIYMAVTWAVIVLGGKALFWVYPSLFIIAFVTDHKLVRYSFILSFVTFIPLAFYVEQPEVASRFVITLGLTCYFSSVLVNYLIKLNDKLIELAIRDPLTNALNRRQLESYLQEAIEETNRNFGPASLILLDIDNFKEINDTLGHEVGDNVLKKMVGILHRRQRRLDYVFRIGGEEFLILLRNTSLQQAIHAAESLREYINKSEILNDKVITVSLGVAEYNEGESSDEWLVHADTNLYEAKNRGRNRVHPETN